MKVNLLLNNKKDVLSGYINIDPLADADDSFGRVQADIAAIGGSKGFDDYCDDAEAVELNAIGVLSFFPARDINDIFAYWLKKLRHGGVLRVSDVDLLALAKNAVLGATSIEDVNVLLYGEQREPWEYRKCAMTINQIVDTLRNMGFKILKKRVLNCQFIVEAQRL